MIVYISKLSIYKAVKVFHDIYIYTYGLSVNEGLIHKDSNTSVILSNKTLRTNMYRGHSIRGL